MSGLFDIFRMLFFDKARLDAMLTYELDRAAESPLYLQLYRCIRSDVESGAIDEGERLPSKRALARHLAVSVMTVEGAYAQLVAEGYVKAEPRRGFFACKVSAGARRVDAAKSRGRPASTRDSVRDASDRPSTSSDQPVPERPLADLTGMTPPAGIFPYAAWARAMRRVLADESEQTLLRASNAHGSLELRDAIAEHLRGYRGMDVHPDQIVVGSGAQSLYGLIVQLLGRERVYAYEDPGYPRLASVYRSNDVRTATVGLDARGPVVEELERTGASVFHCMPSHQFPTGVTTAVGRRHELLDWASNGDAPDRYIVEDDYDCEFRMEGRPVPPLYSLDGNGCVIYANTFTKTLGAAFRIGYMVLPPHLVQRFEDRLGFYQCPVGALEQLTLARFIVSGEYERHVNRQRTHFRRLQARLVKELEGADARSRMRFANVGAGLHFVLELPGILGDVRSCEQEVVERARANGVALAPMHAYRLGAKSHNTPAFVVSFTSLEEESIPQVANVIANAMHGMG